MKFKKLISFFAVMSMLSTTTLASISTHHQSDISSMSFSKIETTTSAMTDYQLSKVEGEWFLAVVRWVAPIKRYNY